MRCESEPSRMAAPHVRGPPLLQGRPHPPPRGGATANPSENEPIVEPAQSANHRKELIMTAVLAPNATTTLADLPAATSAYLNNQVVARISRVTANLDPGEDGTFSVRWTNAAAPSGIRLTDVVLHLTVGDPDVVQLKVPGSALLQPRLVNDINAPRPAANSEVEELFIFLPGPGGFVNSAIDSTLDVGESGELNDLGYHAEGSGTSAINLHIHATVAFEDLFPRGAGDDGTHVVEVLR